MSELTSSEKIERILEKYFQQSAELHINGELFKKGKFLLLENKIIHNNFYFDFIVEKTKKVDVLKIPYPFKIEEHDDGVIYFDYRLSSLFPQNNTLNSIQIKNLINNLGTVPSKLFDAILEIKFN